MFPRALIRSAEMEARIERVRDILNMLTDRNGRQPFHDGKGRFWNLPRDQFVNGPIYGKVPVIPGKPSESFLVQILAGSVDATPRMPTGGPYITDEDLQFIRDWIDAGAPDADDKYIDSVVERHSVYRWASTGK